LIFGVITSVLSDYILSRDSLVLVVTFYILDIPTPINWSWCFRDEKWFFNNNDIFIRQENTGFIQQYSRRETISNCATKGILFYLLF